MIRTLLASAALTIISAGAFAQDWSVDAEASSVAFEVAVFGQLAGGAFEDFDAEITLDPDDLEAARISAAVSTVSGGMGNRDFQTALRSSDGLDPGAHPEAVFVSEDIRRAGDGYEAHGALTIRGETTDIVLPFTLEIENGRAVAAGEVAVDRSAFGIGGSGWGDVADEVVIRVHIEADAG